jgi:hypothetical protein
MVMAVESAIRTVYREDAAGEKQVYRFFFIVFFHSGDSNGSPNLMACCSEDNIEFP